MRPAAATAVSLVLALSACTASSPPSSEADPSPAPTEAQSSSAPGEAESSRAPSAPKSGRPPSYAGEAVRAWPTTSRNPPGVYSWDGKSCAGGPCITSFMHNGYGPGHVTLNIRRAPRESSPGDRWTTATVAGHNGFYRRAGARDEWWRVEIEGTPILIHLATKQGARKVERDEAHAVIASMATQKRDTELGFGLVFRLTTNDWDSG